MRGIDIKQIRMRSFQISGLTAKWGIGGGRSPIWDNNLVGRWDARTFPDGALATIPNTATMAGKAPDLTVTGATMASGTLQFDGVDDEAFTQMGFRQLLIFNKELSQAEVNDVLSVMFPA